MAITSAIGNMCQYNGITTSIKQYQRHKHFVIHLGVYIKMMNLNIFSDLRKPGLVPGENFSPSIKFDSVLQKNIFYIMSNRMRSVHMRLQYRIW